jgi:hypothetical protein
MAYRLTVRHGSRVERESYDDLDRALAAAEAQVERIAAQGPLPKVSLVRTFEPGGRVAARVEISRGGLLRGRSAGVDVMGDGALVAFAGGVRRQTLEPAEGKTVFDAIRNALQRSD